METSADHDNPQTLRGPYFFPGLPTVHLQILRGRARHRRRPVEVPVFLIGSADDCDLVLGDVQMPEVHVYLFVTPQMVTIRHLSQGPDLMVNEKLVSTSLLADQDRIRTGPYEFEISIQKTTVRYQNHTRHEQVVVKRRDFGAAHSTSQPARELIQEPRRDVLPIKHDINDIHRVDHPSQQTNHKKETVWQTQQAPSSE